MAQWSEVLQPTPTSLPDQTETTANTFFDLAVWGPALTKYGAVAHLSVSLFDAEEHSLCGAIPATRISDVLLKHGHDPGLYAECARACLAQTIEDRPPVVVTGPSGLSVVGVSLLLDDHIVGALVAG